MAYSNSGRGEVGVLRKMLMGTCLMAA